jgi:hypothetical protein
MSNSSIPGWRQFEQLVARIEELAAPTGVVVRSPDRLRSRITGKLREVDASLRATLGTATILVTIECRKRKPKQDVTWIEQLATKREAIGAARTIAVSPVGFSAQAHEVAEFYGIELRVLTEIESSDLAGWLPRIQSVIHVYNHCVLRRVKVDFLAFGASEDSAERDWRAAAPANRSTKDRVFVRPDGSRVSLDELWLDAQARNDYYGGLTPEGASRIDTVRIVTTDDALSLEAGGILRKVAAIELQIELSKKVEEIPLSQARVVQYAGPAGLPVQRFEVETKKARTNVRAAFQSSPEGDVLHFSAEFITPRDDT